MKRFVSIRKKIITLYLLLLLLPIILIGLASYRQYTSSMERDVEVYLKQVSEQININIDRYMLEINKLTILPLYDKGILDILRSHLDKPYVSGLIPSSEGSKMQMFMLSAGYDRSEIDEIVIYTMDGIAFSSLSSAYGYEYAKPPAGDTMNGRLLEMGIYLTSPYEKPIPETNRTKSIVSVYRQLRNPYEDEAIGWIRIDLDEKMFTNVITPPLKNYPSQIYIATDDHTIFYPPQSSTATIQFEPQDRVQIDGVAYRCYTRRSDLTQLNVYQIIAENDLTGDAAGLVRFTFLLALVVVSVAVLLAIFFAYKLTQPVKELSLKMAMVERGDFTVRTQLTRNDELGALCTGFNHMVMTIGDLITENYQTKLLKQEAELIALQNQMNPHFLYNTLDMINMSALASRQFEISDIVVNLGKMLRYTVNNENSMVPLSDELQFVKAYVGILQIRVGDKLQVTIDCPAELEMVSVPKLMLQPLVENAFKHGLDSSCGSIVVQVKSGSQGFSLTVTDDGLGISQEKLEQLRQHITTVKRKERSSFHKKKNGHALRNLYRRLQLSYGPQAVVSIDSVEGQGCVVSASFPWKRIELAEEEANHD